MLDNFKALCTAQYVCHSNFHCNFPPEFLGLGRSSLEVSFPQKADLAFGC